MNFTEPTAEQCSAHEKVFECESRIGYAIWYPQMGGYGGRAITLLDKSWTEYPNGSAIGGCFDVMVWHDGEWPFHDGENPTELHHCDPQQFIRFGEAIAQLNEKGRVDPYTEGKEE